MNYPLKIVDGLNLKDKAEKANQQGSLNTFNTKGMLSFKSFIDREIYRKNNKTGKQEVFLPASLNLNRSQSKKVSNTEINNTNITESSQNTNAQKTAESSIKNKSTKRKDDTAGKNAALIDTPAEQHNKTNTAQNIKKSEAQNTDTNKASTAQAKDSKNNSEKTATQQSRDDTASEKQSRTNSDIANDSITINSKKTNAQNINKSVANNIENTQKNSASNITNGNKSNSNISTDSKGKTADKNSTPIGKNQIGKSKTETEILSDSPNTGSKVEQKHKNLPNGEKQGLDNTSRNGKSDDNTAKISGKNAQDMDAKHNITSSVKDLGKNITGEPQSNLQSNTITRNGNPQYLDNSSRNIKSSESNANISEKNYQDLSAKHKINSSAKDQGKNITGEPQSNLQSNSRSKFRNGESNKNNSSVNNPREFSGKIDNNSNINNQANQNKNANIGQQVDQKDHTSATTNRPNPRIQINRNDANIEFDKAENTSGQRFSKKQNDVKLGHGNQNNSDHNNSAKTVDIETREIFTGKHTTKANKTVQDIKSQTVKNSEIKEDPVKNNQQTQSGSEQKNSAAYSNVKSQEVTKNHQKLDTDQIKSTSSQNTEIKAQDRKSATPDQNLQQNSSVKNENAEQRTFVLKDSDNKINNQTKIRQNINQAESFSKQNKNSNSTRIEQPTEKINKHSNQNVSLNRSQTESADSQTNKQNLTAASKTETKSHENSAEIFSGKQNNINEKNNPDIEHNIEEHLAAKQDRNTTRNERVGSYDRSRISDTGNLKEVKTKNNILKNEVQLQDNKVSEAEQAQNTKLESDQAEIKSGNTDINSPSDIKYTEAQKKEQNIGAARRERINHTFHNKTGLKNSKIRMQNDHQSDMSTANNSRVQESGQNVENNIESTINNSLNNDNINNYDQLSKNRVDTQTFESERIAKNDNIESQLKDEKLTIKSELSGDDNNPSTTKSWIQSFANPTNKGTFERVSGKMNNLINRITQLVYIHKNGKSRQTNFRLDGKEYGSLEIQFAKQSSSEKATILVENESVRAEIKKYIPSIQENLQQKGFNLSSLEVEINNRSQQQNFESKYQWNQNHRGNKSHYSNNNGKHTGTQEPETNSSLNSPRKYGYNTIEVFA